MREEVSTRVSELVAMGWEPRTSTETSASLSSRGPFAWWLFIFVVLLFPLIGGLLYLAYWLATSRVTVFVFQKDGEVKMSGGTWMVDIQLAQREVTIEEHRQIKERGFWNVMWPKMLVMLVFIVLWILILSWIF